MKISHLKNIIKDDSDDTIVFCHIYDKSEADEYVSERWTEGKPFEFTAEQWEAIVEDIDRDDHMWQQIYDAFDHYIHQKYEEITKGKNDNSK